MDIPRHGHRIYSQARARPLCRPMVKPKKVTDDKLRNFVFVCIITIWLIAMLMDIFSDKYEVPVEVTGMVGLVVGWFTADRMKKK